MSKHTPGPWIYDEENDGGIYCANGTYVGAAVKLGTDKGSANASLMAAAPELLEALEDLLEVVQVNLGLEARNAVAAIAKAKGKS